MAELPKNGVQILFFLTEVNFNRASKLSSFAWILQIIRKNSRYEYSKYQNENWDQHEKMFWIKLHILKVE